MCDLLPREGVADTKHDAQHPEFGGDATSPVEVVVRDDGVGRRSLGSASCTNRVSALDDYYPVKRSDRIEDKPTQISFARDLVQGRSACDVHGGGLEEKDGGRWAMGLAARAP